MRIGPLLPKRFYEDDPARVAQRLLGKVLCRTLDDNILAGIIVETEAYYGDSDPASRAYGGRKGDIANTLRGEAGRALIYGVHGKWLFNIVAHEISGCGGVLIRALEPTIGIEVMKRLRGNNDVYKLTNGPGRLSEALKIDKSLNKIPVYLENSQITVRMGREEKNIARSFRIGVVKDLDVPLRFYVKNSRFLSVKK
jgi:DNA-3-methyladenine glycosylase